MDQFLKHYLTIFMLLMFDNITQIWHYQSTASS